MSRPILDLADRAAVISALEHCTAEDLHFLNKAVVAQLKAIRSDSYARHMARFAVGDRVVFADKSGEQRYGSVLRLNKKTVSLVTDEGERWNVAPQLLEPESSAPHQPELDLAPGGQPAAPYRDAGQGNEQATGEPANDDPELTDQPNSDWVGGVLTLPGYITGEGPAYRPQNLVWMDPQGQVRGMVILRPGELHTELVGSLQRAIDAPMAGEPHKPARVRVADKALVAQLARAFADIDFVYADTPELAPLAESLAQLMDDNPGDESQAPQTWLDSGAEPEAVAALFRAAAGLYRASPWQSIPHDQCLIGVAVASLNVHDAVLSVIGQMGQHFGFMLFPSLLEHERYLLAADAVGRDEQPEVPAYIALTFDPGAEIAPAIRKEISEHGWPVPGAQAYPNLFTPDGNGTVRPFSPDDIALAEALCLALPELVKRLDESDGHWVAGAEPKIYRVAVATHAGTIEMQFTVPCDYPRLLETRFNGSALIGQLMAIGRVADELDQELARTLHSSLEEGYKRSAEWQGLAESSIGISHPVLSFAANYLNETIATLHPNGLGEILFEIVPRKVTIDPEHAQEAIEELRAFYRYLQREHGLLQAGACLAWLDDTTIQLLSEALDNRELFGPAKSILDQAAAAGFDTRTPEGLAQMMESLNGPAGPDTLDELYAGSIAPPTASATKPSPPDKKTRKDKRKAARKARKKNR